MKLLIITQKVDKQDPILGFFHRWIEEFARHCEKVTVICLGKGEYDLPGNVKVLSLGKEEGKSKAEYLSRFYRYIWNERKNYDVVFIHMNQEYVILGWKLWRLLGKKIYLWRNHAKGNFFTRISVFVSNRVFCTSPDSFTAKYSKTEIMPVGIDTEFFKPDQNVEKKKGSVLFLGRISPVKMVLEFIEWFNGLEEKFEATIAGPVLEIDKGYAEQVKNRANSRVKFIGPVSQDEAKRLYQTHELYVNLTPSGSMDKTILEAASCGTAVKLENKALKSLEKMSGEELRKYVISNHSLASLVSRVLNDSI